MWEAYGLENSDFLWAGTAFHGGIAGHQKAPCGSVSAAAIALGLRESRFPYDGKEAGPAQKAAFKDAAELVRSFNEKFGDINCLELLGVELSDEVTFSKAVESGAFKKCDNYVRFVIEKLYALEEKRSSPEEGI